jgi:hypothetical protein
MAESAKLFVRQQNIGMINDPKKELNGALLEEFER